MRSVALWVAMMLLLTCPALAVAPVDQNMVKAAQDYGRSKADMPLPLFLQPWTVYEENAPRLDDMTERVCLYTPFLLLASDARDRTAAGEAVTVSDAGKVLADYKGYVIFGVTLSGERADFAGRVSANLRQGRKTFRPKLVHAPPVAVEAAEGYQAMVYLYFASRDVATEKPAQLTVAAADGRKRVFGIPFAGYR
ncbi:hypothetical protein [Anaeroselena agilis]|uniref:Uncharacterized protein n=1 Tax=Anaeroselena agilis TaxID=3063788 RepID=A0ABU3NZ07_9FIRM|nr:hypothetical protein [Selenomonadales bacterium 4137-cl]